MKLLIARGIDVVVLDDLSSGYRENVGAEPELIIGDIRDEACVDQAMRGCDTVFHLAASVGNKRSIENPVADSEVNVIGTIRVLESARRQGVRKIVASSSAAIYGELTRLPIKEDHPAEPDSPYGASKLAAEKLCLSYAKIHSMECVCLRYFNVYGVNQRYDAYGNVIPIFAHRILAGRPVFIYDDGQQTRDFVNVNDVAQANFSAALASVSGAFNIASGSAVKINDLALMMFRAADVKPAIEYMPKRQGDVRHSLADTSAASTAFGYAATHSIAAGLDTYLSWAREAITPA